MQPLKRIRRWLREHPRAADGLLALGVLGLAVILPPRQAGAVDVPGPVTVLALLVSCSALVLRRSHPGAVWGWTLTVAVLGTLGVAGPSATSLPVLVALYTWSARAGRRIAVRAAAGTAVGLIVALVATDVASLQAPTTYALLAWCGMAAAVGVAVGAQRAAVADAIDRARRAEDGREAEAQRRVTEERLRIARELHDVAAHHIAVINVQAGVAGHLLDSHPAQAREALGHVRASSRVVLAEMSTILGLLRTPEAGPDTQPAPGLAQLGDLVDAMRHAGLRTTWRLTGQPRPLTPAADLTAYRIVQESLTNAHKHGDGEADMTVAYQPSAVVLEVANRLPARGRSHDVAGGEGAGHGLTGIRERATALGAVVDAGPTSGGRFVVRVELPA